MSASSVRLWREPVSLPTYEPQPPNRLPLFFEQRVYQGSSGRVYPLPVVDRIADRPTDRAWDAVHLENEFLRVLVLPEIGGRIHAIQDKTNGYDLIYRQPVIKPALVGLAGAWASGGIEFNWPQHHRPSTFLPADVHLEEHADGSKTVWLSEHDPLQRMKGMHGVCLHPGRAVVELKVRVYNRTPFVQTFLWWANVATRVHEAYQSFFPPDVTYVADHAKRSMSTYPLCTGRYYGVDYAARARDGVPPGERSPRFVPPPASRPSPHASDHLAYAPNDLSWYANIPVPTSYMCMGSSGDFFGGYDHRRRAGLVHVANHHIAPGKKQWTWGNHEFGYAWDRNLTEADEHGEFGPYIELMAGVYTDNQPDFAFLQPGETKSWSQFWYPIREIGPAQQANLEAALSLRFESRQAVCGVAVTRARPGATLRLTVRGRLRHEARLDLAPDRPHVATVPLPPRVRDTDLCLSLHAADGTELVSYRPRPRPTGVVPPPATEPPAPADIAGNDELFITGLHLEQYRHATRPPEIYWCEALRRDPGDARCHTALGRWYLRRGEFAAAERHCRAAIARLTRRNPNPADGEAHYHLGLCLRCQADLEIATNRKSKIENRKFDDAYAAFYKATWNHAWQAAGYHALAEIDCTRGDWPAALDHLDHALRVNTDNLRARAMRALVLRRLGRDAEADAQLAENLRLDPLDWWACAIRGEPLSCDPQTRLDLAHDCVRAGFLGEALALLADARPAPASGAAPLVAYTAAWICHLLGDKPVARRWRRQARAAAPDYCFPARLEEIAVLESALAADPRDAHAHYYLGNLLYDRRRHAEAIAHWRAAVRLEPANAVAWRNLGLASFNVLNQSAAARRAYNRAFRVAPTDARLFCERDQLAKRMGAAPAARLREFERRRRLVDQRDDLSVEYCALLNHAGRHEEARAILATRRFQPWEGGEGLVSGEFVRTHLALGRQALTTGEAAAALGLFETALRLAPNLGEARHLLVNPNEIHYWIGCARAATGDRAGARQDWLVASAHRGNLQGKIVQAFSEASHYSALALEKLGRRAAARRLWRGLLAYARGLARTPAKIDYFATSLPGMMLFTDDLEARQKVHADFLIALAHLGLGRLAVARRGFVSVLRRDPSHAAAVAHLRELT
jgi:tetratricopeptide (TPR) repeat protein